jgi:uncharacterized membrane protein YqhA
MYTTLERTLIAVFGIYLMGTAAFIINNMMAAGSTEGQMFVIVITFVGMWLVGGVFMPMLIKSYELNQLMEDIDNDALDKIMKEIADKKKKNKKGEK